MSLLKQLNSELTTGRVITDREIIEGYRRDRASLAPAGAPQLVVVARSVPDVQAVLAAASDRRVPVVARGAGSGLSGGANAIDGSIVLVLSEFNQMLDLSFMNLDARVEPGVLNETLKLHAREVGLFYPPDPASSAFSTLGGNIATNGGGLCCMKYGVTRDYVVTLDVVLADGSVLQTGPSTRKNSAGYDLTSLLVGSEGTLGVVVGATLRLVPRAHSPTTIVAAFSVLQTVGELPGRLAESSLTPSTLEIIDNYTIRAIEDRYPMGLDRTLGALVIGQVDTPDSGPQSEKICLIAETLGATETYRSTDATEAEMFLQARKLAYPALEQGERSVLLDDIAVPISLTSRIIQEIAEIAQHRGVAIATFGHLGDGNLHPTILFDARDPADCQKARDAFNDVLDAALRLDGTITGEHGIGNLKNELLGSQLDESRRRVHSAIKAALDPGDILNPGKALAWR